MRVTRQSDVGALRRVIVTHASDVFPNEESIRRQWRSLGYVAPPDPGRAAAESDRFIELLLDSGADVVRLRPDPAAGLDAIYPRDAALVFDGGAILCRMGKVSRRAEPAALRRAFAALGFPIAGEIHGTGTLEGGDVAWLDEHTLAVGRGYRTNAEGIRQLRPLLESAAEVVEVPLPHWRGPADVFHLMSMFSPLDRGLALTYSPLLPVPFRELLLARGYRLVEVAESEFETLGCNALALAPGRCLMAAGNPVTRGRLEHAGVEVTEYPGEEISLKGAGGPTCLTRPLERITSAGGPRDP